MDENQSLKKGDTDATQAGESSSSSSASYAADNQHEAYEGVAPEQFEQAFDAVNTRLDALIAGGAVLVIAIFVCVGVLAVQTLLRSFEVR